MTKTTSPSPEGGWGNFKGNPDKWLEKYFNAFLYLYLYLANEWAEGEGRLVICPKVSLEASPMNVLR
jgi:hypothetical protein